MKSCLILREGALVYQYYKSNKIRDNLQRINSCTKSIISILIGIAIKEGFIPSVNMTMEHYFPDIVNNQADSRKKDITIEHILTMSVELDWPEFGEWNYMPPMFTHDVVKFVFDRELVNDPGTRMNYNSGCSHVLSAILTKATGMKTSDFAEQYLFNPLGIDKDYLWFEDAKGISYGSDGLRLLPYDLAKIGQLYLQKGIWKGNQIVPSEWVRKSTEPYLLTYEYIGHYASHWWVAKLDPDQKDFSLNNRMFFAMGRNGQFIIVIPSLQTVVVFTSALDNTVKPLGFVREYIVKSMVN
ncbi:CubicO group peptidase, beta-lactamase class C family [Paenibacillus uliginis N3/975]|uniref:CubicO group peptidase, beta-lactamase class C family n=1 Tax=Paenibacillus uliginis N3/975 TaxID=1313296 RepID=A0A1X7H3A8_9BACL|nr:serine hydrolase [Paenibacillus uliginis]SMF78839.1 CubicO group peptidase, beta-lactamase class C family [Paenibacillus uliginis N3/975]